MWLVEGTINGRSVAKTTYQLIGVSIRNKHIEIEGKSNKSLNYCKLEDIVSVDVISQEVQTTTGGGVTGAGAGAVLGFLIAGPIGTAVGAGLGSKSKQQGRDNTTIAIGFKNGDALICENATQTDIGKLKVVAAQNLRAPTQAKKLASPPVRSSVKKKNISSNNKKTKILERPKRPPKWDFELKKIKGRKVSLKSKMPALDFLTKWSKIEGCDQDAVNLFNRKCNDEIINYNNFLWLHYDHVLETEGEFNIISESILRNLIAKANAIINREKQITIFNDQGLELANELKKELSELESHNNELASKGFFGKGPIKQNIQNTQLNINSIKKKITANKGKITRSSNVLNKQESKDITSLSQALIEFETIFSIRFPNSLIPKSGHKITKNLDKQYFLDTYKKYFKEIWDKKIKDDKEMRAIEKKLQEKKAKEQKIQAEKAQKVAEIAQSKEKLNAAQNSETKSIKERLIDLKNMFDEDLLTKEEYENQRKNLISEI